ncbi:uncharacterized protein LOC135841386 [Planococcus citri]|uniref:uncharacterized protein LOC135841386 n=1 Tax=Planococcus citri TaxID=170843 RepID=UPI0031F75797
MNKQFEVTASNRKNKIYEYESVDLAKTFPEWKSPLLSVHYMYIQTYLELINAKKKLDEKEKEVEFYNTEMTNKWIELRKKQEDFLNDVKNYNTFFMENENKRQRIQEKMLSEIKFQKKCKLDMLDAKKRIECLDQLESDMKHRVNSLQPYHDYLTDITNKTERFDDVSVLINYYVLLNSETKLQETFIANLLESERSHTQLLKSLKTKMNSLNQERSKSLELKKDYLNKTNDLNECDERLNQKKSQANVTASENIYMKQACDNIFQKLCNWKRKRALQMTDNEKLIFIENTINELKNAVQLAYELSYKDDISNKTDSSFITQKRLL